MRLSSRLDHRGIALIKVVAAQIAVGLLTAQYIIDGFQRAVRDRHYRPLLAAFAGQTVEERFG
jgi:hypothetical protein